MHFAARPDAGVAEAIGARPGVRVAIDDAARGAELESIAAGADVLVTRAWQRVDAAVLRAGRAGRLRAVVQGSAGRDNVDLEAAEALGVAVVFADPGNAVSVAELVMLSLLVVFRDVRRHWEATPRGLWPDRDALSDREVRGKTLGLVGLGRVGKQVAARARAFEMRVLAVDPYLDPSVFAEHGVSRIDALDAMLPSCDVLSLHCPLTAETRGLIDARRLAALPQGAVVVNTARGGIVDEAALVQALDLGRITMAVLDVFEREPVSVSSIAAHPRVLATPHAAGHTLESHRARASELIRAIGAVLDRLGTRPPGLPGGEPR